MTVNLTAPTSGPYHGLVIYEDRTILAPPAATFNGGANMNFWGSIYLPHTAVSYAGGGATVITSLVADTINFTGNSNFGADARGAVTGIGLPVEAVIE